MPGHRFGCVSRGPRGNPAAVLSELAPPAHPALARPPSCRAYLTGDFEQPVGGGPRLVLGVTDDQVQPEPMRRLRPPSQRGTASAP
nr:hypothetical protein [Streptomyces brasiliensis]